MWTAEERVKRTIHALRRMMDTNVFNIPELLETLGENQADRTNKDTHK